MTVFYVEINTEKIKTILDDQAITSMSKALNSTMLYAGVYFQTIFSLIERQAFVITDIFDDTEFHPVGNNPVNDTVSLNDVK